MNARYLWSFSHCCRILQDKSLTESFLASLKTAANVLSEYYLDFHDLSALKMATTLFSFLEKKSYDPLTNGYQEDFSHNW